MPHRLPLKTALPLVALTAFVALFIWLINGSSTQPQRHQWVAQWQTLEPFQLGRRAPAAAIYGDYIYIVGGVDGEGNYVKVVEYAPILANGQLGPWRQTSALGEGRFYNAAIAHNGYLYAIGGGTGALGEGNYPLNSVERAAIRADGSLGPWQADTPMDTARRGLKAVLHGDTIYAIGGYSGIFLKSIERARINADGSLGPWIEERHKSLIDRYIHSAAIHGDQIYLLGGHMRDPATTSYGDVEIATIGIDARLSPWRIEPRPLLTPRLVAEAFVLGDYLYIAGGHNGQQRLTSVEVSRIKSDGHLSPWRQTTPLPIPRSAFAVASQGPYVYLLGGAGEGVPRNSVHMARLGLRGELGHTTTD